MATFAQIRRQIGYRPISRQKAASPAQLDLLARLIVDGMADGTVRWDTTTQEAFTAHRASQMIDSIKQSK